MTAEGFASSARLATRETATWEERFTTRSCGPGIKRVATALKT